MATTFTTKSDGSVEVRVRLAKKVDGVTTPVVNIRKSVKFGFAPDEWPKYSTIKTENGKLNFRKANPSFDRALAKIEMLRVRIDELGFDITLDKFNSILHSVLYAEQIEAEARRREAAAAKKAALEAAKRKAEAMTLTKFIDEYIRDIESGEKTTVQHGRKYARGSRFNTANSLRHFKEFMADTGVEYDFGDVDLDCYKRYKSWLMNRDISGAFTRGRLTGKEPDDFGQVKGAKKQAGQKKQTVPAERLCYSDGTIGRFIKQLKAVLRAAETRGYPVNPAYRSTEFKAQTLDIDAIYLAMKEIEAIEGLDLSQYHPESGHDNQIELARDIFMIGVWTAQRVSDYNNIGRQNIKTFDNNGTEQLMVSIHQQKTGRFVEIPCNAKLRAILEKYPDGIPHISEQWLNKYVKILGKLAGIDEMIEIKESRGGEIVTQYYPKYKLICTHTARRTGATLMYLSGIPIYDIMKVTGHRSVATLEKYIRADKLEVAQSLAARYDYFK